MVVALARFAGLWVPSELAKPNRADVNRDSRRLVIHSPKLEGSASGGVRAVPVLPELMPQLQAAFGAAADGATSVTPKLGRVAVGQPADRDAAGDRTGLVPWRRAFQYLRPSVGIDLYERFPAAVASRWAGHTDKTALAHCLDVPGQHFDRASGREGAAESGAA
jgi:integrase